MTKEEINLFCNNFKFESAIAKAEFDLLPELLNPSETLLALVEGTICGNYRDIAGKGLLFATNRRVVFFRKSFIGTNTFEEISLSSIATISFDKGRLADGSISIMTDRQRMIIEQCNNYLAERTVNAIMNSLIMS